MQQYFYMSVSYANAHAYLILYIVINELLPTFLRLLLRCINACWTFGLVVSCIFSIIEILLAFNSAKCMNFLCIQYFLLE